MVDVETVQHHDQAVIRLLSLCANDGFKFSPALNRCGDILYCERLSIVFKRLQVKYGAVAGLNKKTTRLTCGTTWSVCFPLSRDGVHAQARDTRQHRARSNPHMGFALFITIMR